MSGRPFNRTIIELKHDRRRDSRRVLQTFNRTIIELKPRFERAARRGTEAFNRTIIELKHICICDE